MTDTNPFQKTSKIVRTPVRKSQENNNIENNQSNERERLEAATILSNMSQGSINEVEIETENQIEAEINNEVVEQEAICRRCDTTVVDEALECDMCKEWWHGDCMGITEDEITQIGILGRKNVLWICTECRDKYDAYKEKERQERHQVTETELNNIARESIEQSTQGDENEYELVTRELEPHLIKAFKYETARIKNIFIAVDETYSKKIQEIEERIRIMEISVEEWNQDEKLEKLEDKIFEIKKDMKKMNQEQSKNSNDKSNRGQRKDSPINRTQKEDECVENIRKELDRMQKEFNDIKTDSNRNKVSNRLEPDIRYKRDNDNYYNKSYERKGDKERNLVIYHINEYESEDIERRKNHDSEEVNEMLRELGCENIEIIKTSRIGKRKEDWYNYPRPLIVKFRYIEDKWKILGKGTFLKSTENYFGVYFALDMEKEDLEKNKILRHEMVERRSRGESCMIKNGQIIMKRKGRLQEIEEAGQTYLSFQNGNNMR